MKNTSQTGFRSIEDLQAKVLSNERIREAINRTLEENVAMDRTKVSAKAEIVAKEMIGTVTSNVIRFCGWIYLTLLKQVCGSVQFSPKQIKALAKIEEKSCPVIYMPLHYSHLDYILLSLVLFHNNAKVPYIASGNNLHLPIIGHFIKRAGGFFIRRKLDDKNKKDFIYRAVLQSYITELLKDGQSIEVFIEGTRSRNGLPCMPKTGILSLLVDAVVEKHIPDAMIVPVHTSYEKLLEGNFNNELLGQPKKPESLWDTFKSVVKLLFGNYGNVKVNFAEPISLKRALTDICQYSSRHSSLSCLPAIDSQVLRRSSTPECGVSWRKNISDLAEHIIYHGMTCGSFMSSHLLAYLLINHFRDGVFFDELVEAYCRLRTEITSRGRDLGFCGVPQTVVLRGLGFFNESIVSVQYLEANGDDSLPASPIGSTLPTITEAYDGDFEKADSGIFINNDDIPLDSSVVEKVVNVKEKSTLYIKPSVSIPAIYELSYYSNALTPVFAIESIICLSITAVTNFRFSLVDGFWEKSTSIFEDSLPQKMRSSFRRSLLIQKALELCDFLQLDLILCDVVSNLEDCIQDKVQDLISSGCIISTQIGSSKQIHSSYGIDDERNAVDDELLKANPHCISQIVSFQSVLAPFVEALTLVVEQISCLSNPMPQKEFLRKLIQYAQSRVQCGLANRVECCSSETLSHSIRAFKMNNVIESCDGNLRLASECSDAAYLNTVLSKIREFLM